MDAVEDVEGPSGPIPIRIAEKGPTILHPATPEDIEAVQRRLPRGIVQGLSEILLCLGEHAQLEGVDAYLWDPDPITNRIGLEILPGGTLPHAHDRLFETPHPLDLCS